MTEFEKEHFYDALDKSSVDKKVVKHLMAKDGYFYNEIIYSFGCYWRLVFTKYTPESKNTPLGHVCIYGGKYNDRPLVSWNQTREKENYAYVRFRLWTERACPWRALSSSSRASILR